MLSAVRVPRHLPDDEIQVWSTSLRGPGPGLADGARLLSPDELAKADRFHFARDRIAYVTARNWLRRVLGTYLGREPASLRFAYGEAGKPELAGERAGDLRFNLSHSGDRALLAVTRGREVGIDVELVRTVETDLADTFFAAGELQALSLLRGAEWQAAFFRCWTRKEAYLKALGAGMSLRLDGFEVSLAPGSPASLVRVLSDATEAARWQMEDEPVGEDYAAALASPTRGWRMRLVGEQPAPAW